MLRITCHRGYWCPTVGNYECPKHGGFSVCCAHPELHKPTKRLKGILLARVWWRGFIYDIFNYIDSMIWVLRGAKIKKGKKN